MKFDINKEFSFAQVFQIFKRFGSAIKNAIGKMDESSIKTITVNNRKVRINAFRLGCAAALLAVLAGLFVNLVIIPNTTYRPYSDLEFDTGGDYSQHALSDDNLLLNNSGIKVVNNKGKDKWSLSKTLTNPSVDINGKYILLADLDGNCSLTLYGNNGKELLAYPINSEILSAKISKNGTAAAAVSEEGYKGAAVVFNRKGKEVFKWNSGEGYIIDLDISDDGKYIAVAQMMSDGDEAYSKIHIISIKGGNELGCFTCGGEIAAGICFDSSGKVIAVARNKVYGLSRHGELKYEIDLAGKSPEIYDVENGDRLVFLCRDSRGGSVVEIYNRNGKPVGEFSAGDNIKHMSCHKDTIVVSTSRNVLSISPRGRVKKTVAVSHDIMSIGVYGNNRNVLVLGGNKADIIRLR